MCLPYEPVYSPDLNPIENIWGWMAKEVSDRGCLRLFWMPVWLARLCHRIQEQFTPLISAAGSKTPLAGTAIVVMEVLIDIAVVL